MFNKIVISFFIITVITIIIILNVLKIHTDPSIIKYKLHEIDKYIINFNSKKVTLTEDNIDSCVFYTTKQWSSKNNNYILDKSNNRYYTS